MSLDPSYVADTRPCDRCGSSAEDHSWTGCTCLHNHDYQNIGGKLVYLQRCDGGCDPHPVEYVEQEPYCSDMSGEKFDEPEDRRRV